MDCKNYRGISVLSSLGRLNGRILKTRLEGEITDSEEQCGFRAGRSCIDNVFTLKTLIDKRTATGRATHVTFVDLHKAYDSVPLCKLWECMESCNINQLYVNAVKSLYLGTVSCIKVGNKISEEFSVSKGLRQGCCLAPTLFKIYLEHALKTWKAKCNGMGIPVGDHVLSTLLFADDQVVISADVDDACYMLRKLQEEYAKWGLRINLSKTEHLTVGEPATDLMLGNDKVNACNKYKYLGVTFSEAGSSVDDINNKIAQGKRAIRALNTVLWNNKVKRETKTTIYKTILESICTYGSEVWELTGRNKARLKALEMDYWRRSCGVSRLEHITNEEIRRRMEVDGTIIDTIENKRLLWYGHMQRMTNERWPKRVWDWVPPNRRKRGRPRRSWNMDVQEAMTARGLREEEWNNRGSWRLGSGIRLGL